MNNEDFKKCRKLFSDICKGYTLFRYKSEDVYIKHLNSIEHEEIDEFKERYFENLKSEGLPTRADKIKSLKDSGAIDIAEIDVQLEEIKAKIEEQKLIKSKLHLKSKARECQVAIDKLKDEYNTIYHKKELFLSDTCEYLAEKEVNTIYLKLSLFKDKDFSAPLWGDEDFDHVETSEIYNISETYTDETKYLGEEFIKTLALSDFGMNYWRISECNAFYLFNKPISQFTNFQLRLCSWFKTFSFILENCKNIPEECAGNPDKLLDYYNLSKNAKEVIKDLEGKNNVSIDGATQEDLEAMGFNENNSVKGEALIDKAMTNADGTKRKVLSMEEMRGLLG